MAEPGWPLELAGGEQEGEQEGGRGDLRKRSVLGPSVLNPEDPRNVSWALFTAPEFAKREFSEKGKIMTLHTEIKAGVVLKILLYSLISEGTRQMLQAIQKRTQRTETFIDQEF